MFVLGVSTVTGSKGLIFVGAPVAMARKGPPLRPDTLAAFLADPTRAVFGLALGMRAAKLVPCFLGHSEVSSDRAQELCSAQQRGNENARMREMQHHAGSAWPLAPPALCGVWC